MAELATELTPDDVLGDGGIVGEFVADFQPRQSQLGMARLIDEAIALGESSIVEASTGIGKSFAYLVPAMLCAGKVVISTGTRNLQDQLFDKDIPLLRRAVVSPRKIALLKGRSNYACPYRIRKHRAEDRFRSRDAAAVFNALADWAETSQTGDIAEFAGLGENDSLWYYATSNADNCLGGDCPQLERCFVLKARREAMDADLLVINHHLYFSDLALKADGFGEILPTADVLIFDEAHQLPEIASHFYGQQLTQRQVELFCRDLAEAEVAEAPDSKRLRDESRRLEKAIADFRLALGRFDAEGDWERIANAPQLKKASESLTTAFADLAAELEPMAGRGRELAMGQRRLETLRAAFAGFLDAGEDQVSWYEQHERGLRLALSPLDIADAFRSQLEQAGFRSVFFTSATLSSQNSFRYYADRLGLDGIECARFDSPFDYAQQALLYLPQDLPDPSDAAFAERFGECCVELLDAAQGHSFILFTSYRMLRLTAEFLRARVRWPLLVQGEAQRSELLHRFMQTDNPVLLGTSSFWEGVDVRGDQLRCVIIDKLPFRAPNDPVYRKRLQRVRDRGGNPFNEIQVPEATLSLRQGVGRLIRDIGDRGVVALCDNRLNTRGYGKGMLDSLPPMRRSSDLAEARHFLQQGGNDHGDPDPD